MSILSPPPVMNWELSRLFTRLINLNTKLTFFLIRSEIKFETNFSWQRDGGKTLPEAFSAGKPGLGANAPDWI